MDKELLPIGEWKNNLRNGQGTVTYPDGGKYIGEFKDETRNGRGVEISPDGSRKTGHWVLGKYVGE